ncbi:MAG: phytanoyl-CoA dioxygenase family protein [Verrucomicrobiales bacterium]|nr:phytanoyl-CoA dioxygenase family protein [Verrucomicrobiales bacterium]
MIRSVFTGIEIAAMGDEADRLSENRGSSCVRHLCQRSPLFGSIASGRKVRKMLPPDMRLVRSILFDKTVSENWAVAWHQDITIALQEEVHVPGYGPWSVKDGVVHAQAPAQLLEKMLTIRVHLDDTPPENGALRVIPGSHLYGRLTNEEATRLTLQPGIVCAAHEGDVLLMTPLILHSSRRAAKPTRRRVVHFEFAPRSALDSRLAWNEPPWS